MNPRRGWHVSRRGAVSVNRITDSEPITPPTSRGHLDIPFDATPTGAPGELRVGSGLAS